MKLSNHEKQTGIESATDRVALRHPLFVAALVLLVLNDHLLKGADLLPGWMTGKLSDFAGLIVAPVVLSALLGARTRRRRAIAFVAVGGWFAAANLFVPVAEATQAFGALLGFSWSFWVDSTDLIALAALPVAWHVASARGPVSPRLFAERAVAGLAVAACVASPAPPDPFWTTEAFLVNRTERSLEVRVRYVEAQVDCSAIRDRFEEVLGRGAFGSGTRFVVEAGETLPLDRGVALSGGAPMFVGDDAGVAADEGHLGTCDVVILTAEGLSEVMVYWDGLTTRSIPVDVVDSVDEEAVSGGLQLIEDVESDRLRLVGAPGYQLETPVEAYTGGSSCAEYGTVNGFSWTELPSDWFGDTVRLTEVRPTIDDCVSVTIEHPRDGTLHAFICVPPEDFPFLPNSEVQISSRGDQELHIVRDLQLEDGSLWRTGELRIARGVERFIEGPFDLGLELVSRDCQGVRMDCGGFRVPAAGGLTLSDGVRYVHPGEVVERDSGRRRARLRVGRAETMLVTHPSCGAGRDVLGARLEALVSYGEESR